MAQTSALIELLKQALKVRGKTYSDVAEALDLSTASVKRLFAEQSLSLKRLDAICAMLDMEATDLLKELADSGWQLKQLSEAQEKAIAEDVPLLLVTVTVLNRLTFEEIMARFSIDEHVLVRKLAWLDRQGIIELLPGNRVRLKVASNFAWRPDGPIQRFFQSRISSEYFRTRFDNEGEKLVVLNGMLSSASMQQLMRGMDALAQEFESLNAADAHLPVTERVGRTVVLAARPWVFGAFADYVRDPKA